MQNSQNPPFPPILGMSLGVLAASTAALFIRFAQQDAPSLVIAAYRLTLAALIILPYALIRERSALKGLTRQQMGLSLLSGVFLAAHFATWISSLAYTSVASSAVLVSTAPLFVALLSTLLLREPLQRKVLVGLAIAMAGSILIGLSDACQWQNGLTCPALHEFFQGQSVQGDLLALAGACAGAFYMIVGRRVRGDLGLIPYITLTYGAAALVLLLLVLISGHPIFGYPLRAYGWFALLALIPQLIAHSAINWALRYLTAALVAIILLAEPVGSSVLAFFLLDETPGALLLIGGILSLAGIGIASRKPSQNPSQRL